MEQFNNYFPGMLVVLFIGMTAWSWRKWPDILIDFGRELYIPWQISNGAVLYRDMTHIFGPASQYFNALLFKIFGASYTVLFLSNLVLLALFIVCLYKFINDVSSKLTAFISCAVVISLFSFSQYNEFGSCNFISPYAHEATHGIILSTLLIYQLSQFAKDKKYRRLVMCGLIAGLVFLMKTEIFISLLAAVFLFFLVQSIASKSPFRFREYLSQFGVFIVFCSVAPLFFFIYFLSEMSWDQAVGATFGGWLFLLDFNVSGTAFHRVMLGFDDVPNNLTNMLVGSLIILLPVTLFLFRFPELLKWKYLVRFLAVSGIFAVEWCFGWEYLSRPTPVLVALSIMLLLIAYMKAPEEEQNRRYLPLLLWASFSFCLLGKMILNSIFYTIGFYLSLPSAVLLVVMLVWFIPEWLNKRDGSGSSFLFTVIIVISIFAARSLYVSNTYYKQKTFSVGEGADKIVTFRPQFDLASPIVAQTIEWLSLNLHEDDTISVLPEGLMLNYITKHINPTRHINFMMPEMSFYGEDNIVQDFRSNSPDYILLVHRDTSNFGFDYFGKDIRYGMKILKWIESNYLTVCLFGKEPLVANQFGIKIMKKRTT